MTKIKPFKEPIYIIRPVLAPLHQVYKKIDEIWESKWLTNHGNQHKALETELTKYLNVDNLTLFCNGTIALEIALQALELKGEVITTPFTFPATVTSLFQKNLKPIFCDINPDDFNINSDAIEDLITPNTSAILGVHVFGNPCDVEKIEKIAKNYQLKVIYDAAHCFGVKFKNKGIGNYGDISMFSFHATKIFHTIEGGALTYNNSELKELLYLLKNFGYGTKDEYEILLPGTNGKLNELQAAIGLLNLQLVEDEIKKRKHLTQVYKENLENVDGLKFNVEKQDVLYNYQYFPLLIDEKKSRNNRDKVYDLLKKYNVFTRKYFYPLCSDYMFFKKDRDYQFPIAEKITTQILCLPLYSGLKDQDIIKICEILISLIK